MPVAQSDRVAVSETVGRGFESHRAYLKKSGVMCPKISIIVAIYNVQDYIAKCLESLSSQTLKDIEIICVNDGSTDKSLEVIEKFAQKDKRIKIINQENKGVAAARNVGLENATGEYLQFVDGDDWINFGLCERVYNLAKKHGSDIVMFNVAFYDNKKNCVINGKFFDIKKWKNHVDENTIHTHNDCKSIFYGNLSAANKLYRKGFIDEIGCKFPLNIRFEDHLFHLHSIFCANKINIIDEKHYYYRQNRKNSMMTTLKSTKIVYDIFDVDDLIEKMIRNIGKFSKLKYLFFQYKYESLSHYYMDINFFQKPTYYKKMQTELRKLLNEEYDMSVCKKMGNFYYFTDVLNYNWFVFYLMRKILDNANWNLREKVEPFKKSIEKKFNGVLSD